VILTHGTPVALFTKCDITPVGLDFKSATDRQLLSIAMTLRESYGPFLMPSENLRKPQQYFIIKL